jgi:hypothetical protein
MQYGHSEFTWYSMSLKLKPVDQGKLNKAEALDIVEGYFDKLKPRYDSAEEATAETFFGFFRTKDEFLELCLNAIDNISIRYEIQTPRTVLFLSLPKILQRDFTLKSKDEAISLVIKFFDLDSVSFQRHIQA